MIKYITLQVKYQFVIEMKKKEQILTKKPYNITQSNSMGEEHMELEQEDRELYLFMRGGFGAK